MIDIYISNEYGNIANNIGRYLVNGNVSTEVNKGFSTCSLEFDLPDRASIANTSIVGTSDILVCKDGDLIWSGFPSRVRQGGRKLIIEGVGYYSLFERYFYNDGSDQYDLVYYFDDETEDTTNCEGTDAHKGMAVKCVSIHTDDVPLLSASIQLKRNGEPQGTLIFYVHTSSDIENGTQVLHLPAHTIEDAAGGEHIEVNLLPSETVFASGSTFYFGFVTDSFYYDTEDVSNNIAVIGKDRGPSNPGNLFRKGDSGWAVFSFDVNTTVVARGKWDFDPGEEQEWILADIIDEYEDTFGEAYPFRVYYQHIVPYTRTLFNLKMDSDITAHEAMRNIMSYGVDVAGDYFPIVMYTYRDHLIRPVYTYFDYVDYSRDSSAYIIPQGENIANEIAYDEMVTQVYVSYDTEDGLTASDLDYTEIPYIYPKEKREDLGELWFSDEAAEILEVIVEQEKRPMAIKSVTLSQNEVFGNSGRTWFPIHRLRAGLFVDMENRENSFVDTYHYNGKAKYFIRGSDYNLTTGEISLDLSRFTDKEMLVSLLTG